MASAPMQPLGILAQAAADDEEDGALPWAEACQQVAGLKLTPLRSPIKTDRCTIKGKIAICGLPIRNVSGSTVVQFGDCMRDYDAGFDFKEMMELVGSGRYKDLPEALSLKIWGIACRKDLPNSDFLISGYRTMSDTGIVARLSPLVMYFLART